MDGRIIDDFHRNLTDETINEHFNYADSLKKNYREILTSMANDYSYYRKHVPKLLSSLENNNYHSVPYSINLFFSLYEELIDYKVFKLFDLSVMDFTVDDNRLDKMMSIFEAAYSVNNQQRISETNFDISSLSDEDKKGMAAFIIRKLQHDCEKLDWDKNMVEVTMMHFVFLRQILVSVNNAELFYHAVGLLFDRLTSSEYYQAGRDIGEEIILSSYKDGLPELGFFNSFRLYSNTASVHAGLLYANLSLMAILQKKPPYFEKFVKEIIWQGIKFFRNVNLPAWSIRLYNNIPKGIDFLGYERRSLDHTYFTVLLTTREPSLPYKLLDYLNKERETVLSNGVNEASPWLLTLYNVKRLYPEADFSPTGLGFFLNVFEMIVPAIYVKKNKDIIDADSPDLKSHLMRSLIRLNETRNSTDFVYDNESAIRISSRLIQYSVLNRDASSFLLSMVMKSDFSILFQSKISQELAPLVLPDVDIDTIETLYDDNKAFLKLLPVTPNVSIIWLGLSEEQIFQLQLFNGEYTFYSLSNWEYTDYEKLIDDDFFINLSFTETIKDKSGVRLISPEEFEIEEYVIKKRLNIAKISISNTAESVYIVKDMEISKLPHNLLLNENGELISKLIPVTNILSTEWLLQTKGTEPLGKDYSKSIWIPIESGDLTLNYLYSNIEQDLKDNSFNVFTQPDLVKPLSSDINIVCSHGSKNISEIQILFQEDNNNSTYDLNTVAGRGKVLIFFVCYSGSMRTDFFRNNVTSLVKRFITQGYEAVIAPFWALDVTIPRYWLPEFLSSLDAGMTISQAVFNANKKVYKQYPTPAAWACLHLYGNPNIYVSSV